MASIVGTIPKPVRMDSYGVLRVGDTRVSLDSVVYAFNRGEDAVEIQYSFDTLSLAEVHAAIGYYLHNKEKVDAYLKKQKALYEKLRAENHALEPVRLMREKILTRKKGVDPDWKK